MTFRFITVTAGQGVTTLTLNRNRDGRVLEASLTAGYYLNGAPTVGKGPYTRRDPAGNVQRRTTTGTPSDYPSHGCATTQLSRRFPK